LGCRETTFLFLSKSYAHMPTTTERLKQSVLSSLPKAKKTVIWLLKIIIPISLGVSILQYLGFIDLIAGYLTPVFSLIGLPGEAAIVFITSIFMSLYAPIAILTTLPLSPREITILAVMCLITHNMIVETAVQSKTGSNYAVMFILRVGSSFVAAYFLNLLLPAQMGTSSVTVDAANYDTFLQMLQGWLISSFWLIVKVVLIITGLMMLQNILKEFRWLDVISRSLAPLMSAMGLPRSTSFLWFVAHILGLTYGSAVMIDAVENGELSKPDANFLNFHIAVNHSTLEDTLLFAAIGVPVLWMIIPRFVLAILIVWIVRLWHFVWQKQKPVTENY